MSSFSQFSVSQEPVPSLRVRRSLSIIIPALNEEDGIREIVERVEGARAAIASTGLEDLEIIVVDDGSSDATAQIVESLPSVRLIRHPRNRGYGAAIKTGFAHAHGELLAFLDADSTYPPESFSSLCEAALNGEADLVVGSRRSGEDSRMPPLRRLGNWIWSGLVSLIGNQKVSDPASGMRVLRRSALARLYPLPDGLNFTPVMSTRAVHEGLKVVEIPIPYSERSGRSKLSVVRDGLRFLATILSTALEYSPVRILGFAGLLSWGVASVLLGAVVALRLSGVTYLGPWGVFAVFGALVLGVTGMSLFSLGAIWNHLATLLHGRPVCRNFLGRPILQPNLDQRFGWMGVTLIASGAAVAIISLVLASQGWDISRLWLWLVGSSLIILTGVQLIVSWILLRVMEKLSRREKQVALELVHAQAVGIEP